MKQFPSCCQSENKEIQVPLGWPTVIVFADSWSTVYRRADGVVNRFRKLDAESIFPFVMELIRLRLQPFWWF